MKKFLFIGLTSIALCIGFSGTLVSYASPYVVVNGNQQKTVSAISNTGRYVQITITKYDRNGNPTEGRAQGDRVFISTGNFVGPDGEYYTYRAIPERDSSMSVRYFFN